VRATSAGDSGRALVELAGLTRSDAAGGFETEFAELTEEFGQALRSGRVAAEVADGGDEPPEGADGAAESDEGPAEAAEAALAKSKGE
jgi:hypothetical protein